MNSLFQSSKQTWPLRVLISSQKGDFQQNNLSWKKHTHTKIHTTDLHFALGIKK